MLRNIAWDNILDLIQEPCSNLHVGCPLTNAFHCGRSKTIWAALVASRPAELRSCLIESAHLVFGRPLDRSFPVMKFDLKS